MDKLASMSDCHECSLLSARHRRTQVLLPALLFSLAVHAAAGSLLFNGWQRTAVEPPPLTVMLEAAPPLMAENPPRQVDRSHMRQEASSRASPVLPLHHAPVPSPITAERANPIPIMAAPAPENAPAPTIVAKAPAAVNAAGRAETLEPPHFNVAYLNNPRPAYPPIARRLGLEGLVVLRVQVSAAGAPEQVAVAQTSGAPVLDEAALKAVQVWTFVPARRGDTPVAHVVDVPIRFQLKN